MPTCRLLVDVDPVGLAEALRRARGGLRWCSPTGMHSDLDRREPERKGTGVVLGEDPDEALERAEQGAVDHDRVVLGVVGAQYVRPKRTGIW